MIASFVIVGSEPSNRDLVDKLKNKLEPLACEYHVTEDTDAKMFNMRRWNGSAKVPYSVVDQLEFPPEALQ